MTIRPLWDRVLVRKIVVEEEKVGSLYRPATARHSAAFYQAEVLSVGPRANSLALADGIRLEVGDMVLVDVTSKCTVGEDGEHLYLVEAEHIAGVLE
jgi:chaperonin GroES